MRTLMPAEGWQPREPLRGSALGNIRYLKGTKPRRYDWAEGLCIQSLNFLRRVEFYFLRETDGGVLQNSGTIGTQGARLKVQG